MEEVMDDNNYMNNDNRSSGTPDNTGVFGQSYLLENIPLKKSLISIVLPVMMKLLLTAVNK